MSDSNKATTEPRSIQDCVQILSNENEKLQKESLLQKEEIKSLKSTISFLKCKEEISGITIKKFNFIITLYEFVREYANVDHIDCCCVDDLESKIDNIINKIRKSINPQNVVLTEFEFNDDRLKESYDYLRKRNAELEMENLTCSVKSKLRKCKEMIECSDTSNDKRRRVLERIDDLIIAWKAIYKK